MRKSDTSVLLSRATSLSLLFQMSGCQNCDIFDKMAIRKKERDIIGKKERDIIGKKERDMPIDGFGCLQSDLCRFYFLFTV